MALIPNLATRVFGPRPARVSPTKIVGAPGFAVYMGHVTSREKRSELIGVEKFRTYSDLAVNTSIIAAGVRLFLNLVAKPDWSVEAAEDLGEGESSDAAKAAADFVTESMHGMSTSWVRFIKRLGYYRFMGFTVQEWVAKRDAEGRLVMADVLARPPHTIERWDVDDQGSVLGIVQRSPQTSEEIYLPRGKVVYVVEDTLTDEPEGVGLFRHLIDPAARLERYHRLEAVGFDRDLRGTPVGRAPLTAIQRAVASGEMDEESAQKLISGLEQIVRLQSTTPETGLILDSQPFEGMNAEGPQPTAQLQWALELLQGESRRSVDIGAAIARLNHEMARIMCVDHMLLGSDSTGSFALSEDKSTQLYLTVDSTLGDIAEALEHDYVGALWRLNGWPEELKPTLKPEEVAFRDVQEVTASLRDLATAGAVLAPDDPAIDDVRDMLGLSRQPELDRDLFGALPPNDLMP